MTSRPGSRDSPLWICPQCGTRFVTRDMWHSCGLATLADCTGPDRLGETVKAWLRESYRLMGMRE